MLCDDTDANYVGDESSCVSIIGLKKLNNFPRAMQLIQARLGIAFCNIF